MMDDGASSSLLQVRELAKRSLRWCKPGGYVFFRESCFRQSGDVARTFNPSHYRHPSFYTKLFSTISCQEADGTAWGFELVYCKNLETYVKLKGNKGQICWLWKKVEVKEIKEVGWSGAVAAEKVIGDGFSTLGGRVLAEELVELAQVKGGTRVLDVACGTGGTSRLLASIPDVQCCGVDGSMRAIEVAVEKSMAFPKAYMVMEACDISTKDYSPATFDAITAFEDDQPMDKAGESFSTTTSDSGGSNCSSSGSGKGGGDEEVVMSE